MSEAKIRWPDSDDRTVVAEMLRDRQSQHWDRCRDFVVRLVAKIAKNIPLDAHEDIVQLAMISIMKSLPIFQYRCSLKTWLISIVNARIIDYIRKESRSREIGTTLSAEVLESDDYDDFTASRVVPSSEEEYMVRDQLKKVIALLQEYIYMHKRPERNSLLIQKVLFENYSIREAAQQVGVSNAIAGYVVRSAQQYVRENLD